MAVEIAALVGAVGGITKLVEESVSLINAVRSGFRTDNKQAKEDLSRAVSDLKSRLRAVGVLARTAETYLDVHESLLRLLSSCERLSQFLRENRDDASNWKSSNYAGDWRVIDTLVQEITNGNEVPRRVLLDRAEWFDADDKAKIQIKLNDFTEKFNKATVHANAKQVDGLSAQLEDMVGQLRDADILVKDTVDHKILGTLAALDQPSTSGASKLS